MPDFAYLFDTVKAALSVAADCTITRGRDVITDAMCSGVDKVRNQTEDWRYIALTGTVRYKRADDPTSPIVNGDEVTITIGTDEIDARVWGLKVDASGVIRFGIQEPDE